MALTWVIAIFAMVALLGSVMWLRPSASQQRQAQFRLLARQLGIDVRLAPLPQTRRARVREQDVDQGVVYRLLRFDLPTTLPNYVLIRENADAEWEPQSSETLPVSMQQELDVVLKELPRDAVAVELTAHGPGVYWRERGDEQTVKKLAESMERLLKAMAASASGSAR